MEIQITAALNPDTRSEAQRILRSCVHCGLCAATCPTYQELGDELDSPRGRIYQIKTALEGVAPTRETQQHLDRCLTCMNCTTSCPSGVEYNRLIEIGREYVDANVKRPPGQRLVRWGLRQVLPYRRRFTPLLRAGQALRPLLPPVLRDKIPRRQKTAVVRGGQYARKVIMPLGCVQSGLTPATDAATIRVLDALKIEVIQPQDDGCCGALSQHMSATDEATALMKRNIDSWWTHIEAGAEAIVVTASGCGLQVKNYGYHLKDDAQYAKKAARVSALCRDLCEVLSADDIKRLNLRAPKRIAFHAPCTLQHGQKLMGKTEKLLTAAGFELLPFADAHSCCGSAGTYSILQASLSHRLREKKVAALLQHQPALIATANVGCQIHLQGATETPVTHWITLFDPESQW